MPKARDRINAVCSDCGKKSFVEYRTVNRAINKRGYYLCRRCASRLVWKDDKHKEKMRNLLCDRYNDASFVEKMHKIYDNKEYKENMSRISSKKWEEECHRSKMHSLMNSHEYKTKMSESVQSTIHTDEYKKNRTKLLADPLYHKKLSMANERRWKNNEFRYKMAEVAINQPRVSSQQELLYSLLDDLGIQYAREGPETKIGYYVFDCFVPKQLNLNCHLLFEVQGDYWHSLPGARRNDKSKFTYIDKYFPDCEIMYIWEREFYSKDRVLNRLKQKFGISAVESIDFPFSDVIVKECDRKSNKQFLDLYHYLGPNRGGHVYGAYLDDELIAVCQFSHPVRKEIATSKGLGHKEVLELSRLCIHPSYQKKNFASWFISRTTKRIIEEKSPKLLVAFSDTTMGHQGTIYRASNWTLDGEVKPDYWYVDKDGFVMHKKTLYQRAVRMKKKEREFAEEHGYRKIWGGKKLRFIYERQSSRMALHS